LPPPPPNEIQTHAETPYNPFYKNAGDKCSRKPHNGRIKVKGQKDKGLRSNNVIVAEEEFTSYPRRRRPTTISNLLRYASNLPYTHFTWVLVHGHFNQGKHKIDHHKASTKPHKTQDTRDTKQNEIITKAKATALNTTTPTTPNNKHNTTQKTDKEPLSNFLN
jgi:hypothetical protein